MVAKGPATTVAPIAATAASEVESVKSREYPDSEIETACAGAPATSERLVTETLSGEFITGGEEGFAGGAVGPAALGDVPVVAFVDLPPAAGERGKRGTIGEWIGLGSLAGGLCGSPLCRARG
jgi:hypothetical protein